jgi:hypothetical protein
MNLALAGAVLFTAGTILAALRIRRGHLPDQPLWKKVRLDMVRDLQPFSGAIYDEAGHLLDDEDLWRRMGTRGVRAIWSAFGAMSTLAADLVRATDDGLGNGGSPRGQALWLSTWQGRGLCCLALFEAWAKKRLPAETSRPCARMLARHYVDTAIAIEALDSVLEYV